MIEELSSTEYCCPGETYAISRAVHLARLSGYYAACRDCPRRQDTAGLSTRQVRRVAEVHKRYENPSQLGAADVRNMAINDMSPPTARAISVEFVRRVLEKSTRNQPAIVFAGDGRLSTAAIVAAVVESIRWVGCAAVDLGAASAPCMAQAIEQLRATGGIYLGNPGEAAHTIGMKFWIGLNRADFNRLAADGEQKIVLIDRPARAFGPLRRWNAAEGYLSELRPAYHALRPLRFVLRCRCEPIVAYLTDLLQNVACRIIPFEPGGDLGPQVAAANAHFGIEIANDGEKASFFDERGQPVAAERLGHLIVAETDALRSLTHVLVLLSRNDLPFSAVLDRAGPAR